MNKDLTIGTKVDHDLYGEGIIGNVNLTTYDIYFARGGKVSISKNSKELNVLQKGDMQQTEGISLDVNEFEKMFSNILDSYGLLQKNIELGNKWEGGTLIIRPGKEGLQEKNIPIESFFHKIVMIRDRLRVLEQNINSNDKLSDEEKINLQQYITRAYGSLTTFNILFENKNDYFIGSGKA